MTPEGQLKKDYRAWLRAQGAFFFSPVQMGYGKQGVDDFVCLRGQFYAIEAKRNDEKAEPTKRQWDCLKEVAGAYGCSAVVRSLYDVKHLLALGEPGGIYDRTTWDDPETFGRINES